MSQLIILFNIVVWLHPLVLLCDAVEFFFFFLLVFARRVLSLLLLQLDQFAVLAHELSTCHIHNYISIRADWVLAYLAYVCLLLLSWYVSDVLFFFLLASFILQWSVAVHGVMVCMRQDGCWSTFVYRSVWRNHSVIVGSLVIWIIRFCVKNSFIAYVRHYFMSRIFMYGR